MPPARRLLPIAFAGLCVLAMASLPEIAGWSKWGHRFIGVPNGNNLLDSLHYVERAREGAEGVFRIPNFHTPEPAATHPQLIPVPGAVGLLLRGLGLSPFVYPLAAKLLFGATLLGVLALIAWRLFPANDLPIGLAYLWLGGGFFWILDLPAIAKGHPLTTYLERLPTLQAESASFFTFYFQGHLAFALALMTGCLWAIFLAEAPRPRTAAALAFLLAVVHPYDILVAAAVAAVHLVWTAAAQRTRFRAQLIAASAAALGATLPMLGHFVSYTGFRSFQVDDLWLGPFDYLFGYGQPLLFALYYAGTARREPAGRRPDTPLWIAWMIAAPLLMSNPWLYFRRKLALGLSIPLAVLGARGTLLLAARCFPARPAARRAFTLLLTGVACLTPLDIVARDVQVALDGRFPVVLTAEVREVLDWLDADRGRPGALLAWPDFVSQLVPGLCGRRVFRGWSIYVVDGAGKAAQLTRFLDPATPLAEREAFLRANGITLVTMSDHARQGLPLDEWPFLRRQTRIGSYGVWAVVESPPPVSSTR